MPTHVDSVTDLMISLIGLHFSPIILLLQLMVEINVAFLLLKMTVVFLSRRWLWHVLEFQNGRLSVGGAVYHLTVSVCCGAGRAGSVEVLSF